MSLANRTKQRSGTPLDDIAWLILEILQADGRISFRDLGERVGLSAPAVAERVRRLERDGVITGYHASVDFAALGFPILAIVRVTTRGSAIAEGLSAWLIDRAEVIECHRVTGSESHVVRVVCATTSDLELFLDDLSASFDVATLTHIVTSSPVPKGYLTRDLLRVRGTPGTAG